MPKSETVKIRFLTDYEVKDGTGTTYKAGQVEEMNPRSASHFVNRNAAEVIDEAAEKADKAKAAKASKSSKG